MAMRACFCVRRRCRIRYSAERAWPLVGNSQAATASTGRRARVYFAPLPALCWARRRERSVV
ncbi:hypothetical protein D3C72_1980140 [compost metagenome]